MNKEQIKIIYPSSYNEEDNKTDKLANAFYNEDWRYFEKAFGVLPKNSLEAETLLNSHPQTGNLKPKDIDLFKVIKRSKNAKREK